MKIALCLHGYFANAGGIEASVKGAAYIKKNIIKDKLVDVFVHSWEQDESIQQKIKKTYNPAKCSFEVQKEFNEETSKININDFDEGFDRSQTMYKSNSPFQALSFLYSRQQSLKLKKEHEVKNNFVYDCVVLARFDLGQRGKECQQRYYAADINFDETLDMNCLYSFYWDQLNYGYGDHWFYSNSENMDIVGDAFNKVVDYYQINSKYAQSVTTGWPHSNAEDEFSNERLRESPTKKLVKFPKWHCIDNHKFYKWYFIDTDLYDKSKFV